MKRQSPLVSTCLTCCWTLLAAGALALASPLPALADANGDLVSSAAHGDNAKVIALLTKGADVNVRDSGGYTPLIWAALNGHADVVGELLRRGADVHARDKEGYTSLMWASQNHHADAARALLAHGANPNEVDREGYTALTWTAQDGEAGIALDLILNGANPNIRDHAGYTPLMWAAQQGHNSVVKILMNNGANPTIREYKGFSALDLAIAFNRYDVKEYLMHMAPGSQATTMVSHATVYHAPAKWRGRSRTSLVAVVGTPGMSSNNGYDPYASGAGYYNNGAWVDPNYRGTYGMAPATWSQPGWSSLEMRIMSFDIDGNHVVDGRDWRSLTTARRNELTNILQGVRGNGQYTMGQTASVEHKLDWVYADASRWGLTINMAYDYPTPANGKPTW